MTRILILGWGSLIWRPGELRTTGEWMLDGPQLPIEFSRVSENGRLTLVIDELNGVMLPTRYVQSACASLEEVVENLRERERARSSKGIGYADLRQQRFSPTAVQRHGKTVEEIARWGRAKKADAVIWTAIGPRWPFEGSFTVEAAVEYLLRCEGRLREDAYEYVRSAPPEIQTPVRKRFEELCPIASPSA